MSTIDNTTNQTINNEEDSSKYVTLTSEQFEQLKKAGEISLSTVLQTTDELDEIIWNSLGISKQIMDKIREDYNDPIIRILETSINNTIQIYIRRHNIKMQRSNKFNTSVTS